MPRIRSYFLTIAVLLPVLFVLLLVVLSFTVKASDVEQSLVKQIESIAGSRLTFDALKYSPLPWPSVVMTGIKLTDGKGSRALSLTAEHVNIHLHLFPLVFGKAVFQGVRLREGEVVYPLPAGSPLGKIEIKKMDLRLSSLIPLKDVWVDFRGDLFGAPKSLEGKINLVLDPAENFDSFPPGFSAVLKFRQFPLSDLKGRLPADFQVLPQSGTLSGSIAFEKVKNTDTVSLRTDLAVDKLIYQRPQDLNLQTSQPIDAVWQSDVVWNTRNSEVTIKKSSLVSPVGRLDVGGRVNGDTGEMQDMRVDISGLSLEKLPNYVLNTKDMIPFNLGFSGQSNVEMALSGTWDHLSLHGNWDLSTTLLTYGGYFSKSKDVPLNFTFDCLLKKGKQLSGDFSLKLQSTKAKGTIKGIDFESGKAQINIITNKFSIAGWDELLPPLRDYGMEGVVKILANFAGNLQKMGEMQPTINATVENVKLIHRQKGGGIQNAFALVDYGSVALKLRQTRFEIKGSPVELSLIIYNQMGIPIVKGKATSPQLAPSELLTAFEDFANIFLPSAWAGRFKTLQGWAQKFFPDEEPVKNLTAEFTCKKNLCSLPRLDFEAYDGWMTQNGTLDFSISPNLHTLNTEWNHLNLGRLSAVLWKDKRVAEGTLFSKASFIGTGLDQGFDLARVKGEGTLSVTKGNWLAMNLLGALAKTEELKALSGVTASSGTTPFTDLRTSFVFQDGKIKTENLALLANDFSLKASGEAMVDGALNYRAEIYLPQAPAEKVLSSLFPGFQSAGTHQQLGPVPILLAGRFDKPELQIDPALWPAFKERLLSEGSREALTNFLPEEFFFGETAKA